MHHCIAALVLDQLSTAQSRQVTRRLLWNEAGSKVAGCAISISDRLKILGVTLYATLSFDEHITTVVKACNYHLRALRHIRRYITQDTASTIACISYGVESITVMDCYLELLAKHSTVYRGSRTILQEQCLLSASESYTTQAADLSTCYASFTGFHFKPGSRMKLRYFALNATNSECRHTCHVLVIYYLSSIDQRGVVARRL